MMHQRKWLAGLVVGSVVIGSALLGAGCDDDADSPGEVSETAQDEVGDVVDTVEDVADDAVGDDETPTPTP